MFRENDGDVEADFSPMKAPRGNYNIIKDEEVYVLTRDTFAFFVKNRVS